MTSPGRLVVGLAALVLGAAAAPVLPARADGVTALAGTTTIVAPSAGSAWTTVSLAQDVALPGANCEPPAPEVSFSGTADASMVVLTPSPFSASDSAQVITFSKYPSAQGGQSDDNVCAQSRTIPAGTYALAFLHTPGTSAATLTLPGLAGSTTVAPSQDLGGHIEEVPSVLPASPGVADEFGDYANLSGPGNLVALSYLVMHGTGGTSAQGECFDGPGKSSQPPEVVFGPECPGGGSGVSPVGGGGGATNPEATIVGETSSGTYGIGGWFYAAAPSTTLPTAGVLAAWVPFQPAPSVDVPEAPAAALIPILGVAIVLGLRRRDRAHAGDAAGAGR